MPAPGPVRDPSGDDRTIRDAVAAEVGRKSKDLTRTEAAVLTWETRDPLGWRAGGLDLEMGALPELAVNRTFADQRVARIERLQARRVRDGVLIYDDTVTIIPPPNLTSEVIPTYKEVPLFRNGVMQRRIWVQNKVEDPVLAMRKTLLYIVQAMTRNGPHLEYGHGDTQSPFGSTADNVIRTEDATWTTARDGSNLAVQTVTAGDDFIGFDPGDISGYQQFQRFDTSHLGAEVASSLTFSMVPRSNADLTQDFTARLFGYTWATLTTADWRDKAALDAFTLFADSPTSGWVVDTRESFTTQDDSAFGLHLNGSGDTDFIYTSDDNQDGSAPAAISLGNVYMNDEAGTDSDTQLVYSHAAAGGDQEPSLVGGKLVHNSLLLRHLVHTL